jgi:hypothetical protein
MLIFSCNKEDISTSTDSTALTNTTQIHESKPLTSSLVKREVEFKDNSGKNSVVFLFEAVSEKEIDSYLSNNSFSLRPVFALEKEKFMKLKPKANDNHNDEKIEIEDSSSFEMTEKSKSLEKDAVGYALSVNPQSNNSFKNGRAVSTTITYESPTWSEMAYVYANGGASVSGKIYTKWRWYNGWNFSQNILNSANSDTFYFIDGPWKAKATITSSSSYHFEWINF